MRDGRWVTVAESQFAHEKQGLEIVKALLPDAPPFRAWSNFEFRDSRGRWHEVDLLVLARDTLYLIELKHYRGVLTGNDRVFDGADHQDQTPVTPPNTSAHSMTKAHPMAGIPSDGQHSRRQSGVPRVPRTADRIK